MNAKNALYKEVKIEWEGITLPLKEGTPISLYGAVANNSGAIGLVPQTYKERPITTDKIYIFVGGDVDLGDVEAAYGASISDDAKAAMSGIRFFSKDGTPVPDYIRTQYVLPAAAADALGGVKLAEAVAAADTGDDATAAKCATAINAIIEALQAAGVMATPADDN